MLEMERQGETWSVLGAGAWGTALAQTLAQHGHPVRLWDRDPLVVDDINEQHRNRKRYGAEVALHTGITADINLARVVHAGQKVLVALPSEVNVLLAAEVTAALGVQPVVIASKGFRESDGALLSQVWQDAGVPVAQLAVMSGPTFAQELMAGDLTGLVAASPNAELREAVASALHGPNCRVFTSADMVGVQVGGALKNVLAVAAGILAGLGMGHNARALVMTRGLSEMALYAEALGGRRETVFGLAGMGDLLLTATSTLSRNYRFGELVGKGMPVAEAKLRVGTVEGVRAAQIATVQAQALRLDLAILSAVDGILQGDLNPLTAFGHVLNRPHALEV